MKLASHSKCPTARPLAAPVPARPTRCSLPMLDANRLAPTASQPTSLEARKKSALMFFSLFAAHQAMAARRTKYAPMTRMSTRSRLLMGSAPIGVDSAAGRGKCADFEGPALSGDAFDTHANTAAHSRTDSEGVMNRRKFLAAGAAAGAGALIGEDARAAAAPFDNIQPAKRGRLKLSASRWPWGKFTLDQMCRMCRDLGMQGVDLL